MKFILKISALILSLTLSMTTTSCVTQRAAKTTNQPTTIELYSSASPTEHYTGLSHGVNLAVVSMVEPSQMIDNSELNSRQRAIFDNAKIIFTPSLRTFVDESLSTYMKRMGIKVNSDDDNDYRLRVTVKEFKVVRGPTNGRATVILEYSLSNSNNERIFEKVARGRFISISDLAHAYQQAYDKAIADIDWQEIVDAITTHKHPEQEAQRQVRGEGDTALEHTVIRWFIDSAPKGADVTWRIVSSTPDVKNTNSNYLGTTPYESTETFDIKGLKLENSGNVQVEVSCEKNGYLTQRRRFNLRQVIEQKEISTKFNLVKEED